MDVLTTGNENQTDVISDCELIALDFVAFLDKFDDDLFTLDKDSISIEFMYDELHGSKYGGVVANINLATTYDFDFCSVPMSVFVPPSPPIGLPVTIYDQDNNVIAVVPPGGTYTVLVFSGIDDTGSPYSNSIVNNP